MENLITSPVFLEGIVRELGMQKTLMARSRVEKGPVLDEDTAVHTAAVLLAKRVRLVLDGRHLYELGVKGTDPQEAYDLTRFILDCFIEEYRKMRLAPRASTRNFLMAQQKVYQQDLALAEQELNRFLIQISSSELLGNPVNAGNLGVVEERLSRTRDRQLGADVLELSGLEQAAFPILGALPAVATYAKDSQISQIVLELTNFYVELMTRSDGENSDDIEVEMGRLRVQIINRVEELVALNHHTLGLMERNRLSQYIYFSLYSSVRREGGDRVDSHVRNYRRFLQQQPMQSSKLAELQAKVSHTNELLMTIEQEITQQRMNLEAGLSDVGLQLSIRKQPQLMPYPIEPNKLKLAFMGFVLSLGLGAGLLILTIFMDKSMKTVNAIEQALDIPVLGTLPQLSYGNLAPLRRRRLLFWISIVLGVIAIAAFVFLVLYPNLSL